ncbi:tetratricopeptide repeat protein 5-like isoform X3 [Mercenaria mercenaria]|uniref:tetratricopeptide repeat protein 5-like isoform X3 n=1 Tax=Mercenaria mercenaria TaxID=6596 RepID=UPI001E1DE38A|nr:tetratricopeptide repeat protein 5-like isoform X3 [Mercenaria mercenaria]
MASNNKLTPVAAANSEVDALYEFRDHYFEQFGVERAVFKNDEVKRKMEETLKIVESHKDSFPNKAEYFMLLGRTLNVTPDYDSKAYECLSKAVKLDPKLVEAWNHLGELYWKKGDINNAKNCFSGALTHSKNKISLRNLSMVLRQLNVSAEERVAKVEESVEKAKEAVQMDIKDGQSWLILGNAYLSLFFSTGQSAKILQQAMSAYKQAESDPVARNNADLHYNRASAYKFEEDFQKALEGFSHASLLDPSWKAPETQERQLLSYLTSVTQMIEAKGKVKGKRLQTLSQSPRDSALGPYAGGGYTSNSGKSVKLMRCSFKDLETGVNPERVVLGKVACTIPTDDLVPFTFCMIDEDETVMPVNVYNLAQGSGVKIGDSVAIPEPYIQIVSVKHKDKEFYYRGIRVSTPLILVVNGRKLGRDKQVGTVLVVNAVSD